MSAGWEKAHKLHEHVDVQRLPHLRLHCAEVPCDVAEDAGDFAGGQAVRKWRQRWCAIEEGVYDKANGVVEALRGRNRVLRSHLMEAPRVVVRDIPQVRLRGLTRQVQGEALRVEMLSINKRLRQGAANVVRVQSEEQR